MLRGRFISIQADIKKQEKNQVNNLTLHLKQVAGRNINNLRYADDTTLMAESEEELKSLLRKVKVESEKVGLNSIFRKRRSWHLVPSLHGKYMGKQWKQWLTLFFWAPESLQIVIATMKLKYAYSLEGKL